VTTPQSHDDDARSGPSAPDWTTSAYDPPPVHDPYHYNDATTGRSGYDSHGYPAPGHLASPYPVSPYPATPYPAHAHAAAALNGVPKAPIGIAVLAAILFAPLGIWALVLAGQVTTKAGTGDIVGALAAANKAKTVSFVGIAIGAVIAVCLCANLWTAMTNPYYYGTY
jgi:hypothetical protein